jgi:hypothetical protein
MGQKIPPDRFIARSSDRDAWLAARRTGVTATQVALAATPSGFTQAVQEFAEPNTDFDNEFMAFGREAEPIIADWVKHETGIMPNEWLISGDTPHHLATPDGLSLDHQLIAEIKTGGKPITSPPRRHRDQVLWQLHVTGAVKSAYAFNRRVPDGNGWFRFDYWEPQLFWIERDEKRINELIEVADRLMEARNGSTI